MRYATYGDAYADAYAKANAYTANAADAAATYFDDVHTANDYVDGDAYADAFAEDAFAEDEEGE